MPRFRVVAYDDKGENLILDFGDPFNGNIPIDFTLGGKQYSGLVSMWGFDRDAPCPEDRHEEAPNA